jgi:hypothetical protein
MKGTFTRVSPASFAEKVGIPAGWFVISHRWMAETKRRRLAHGRWFMLRTAHGSAFRILRFSPNLDGGPSQGSGELVIDWPGWLDLFGRAENVDGPLEIEITETSWWQLPRLAIAHPDPSIRMSGLLGLLSVALGLLSVVLAVAAL